MSLNPNAPLQAKPAKCKTCDGEKDKNVQLARNEEFNNEAYDRIINVYTDNKGMQTITTFDGGGNELGTWRLGADGRLQ